MTTKRDINSIIGKNLQLLRKQHHLTQADLAEKLGISVSHVANIERGSSAISMNLIEIIIEVFAITPNDLMLEKEAPETPSPQMELKSILDSKIFPFEAELYMALEEFIKAKESDSSLYSLKARGRQNVAVVASRKKKK